jgi:glycosyltransferase EpsE
MNKKVAVIMGVYNSIKTLERAINSLINQTYKNLEIVICNDASNDGSSQLINNYKNKYDNIIVINNKINLGLAKSLNLCLENISNDVVYIARMDSDDFSHESRIEKQVSFLDSNKDIALVSTRANLIGSYSGKFKGVSKTHGFIKKESLIKGPPFIHPTVMIRKEASKKLNGYNDSKSYLRMEDYELWFRFFSLNMKAFCYNEVLFDYYIRPYKPKFDETLREIRMRHKYYRLLSFNTFSYLYVFKPVLRFLIPYSLKIFFSKFFSF